MDKCSVFILIIVAGICIGGQVAKDTLSGNDDHHVHHALQKRELHPECKLDETFYDEAVGACLLCKSICDSKKSRHFNEDCPVECPGKHKEILRENAAKEKAAITTVLDIVSTPQNQQIKTGMTDEDMNTPRTDKSLLSTEAYQKANLQNTTYSPSMCSEYEKDPKKFFLDPITGHCGSCAEICTDGQLKDTRCEKLCKEYGGEISSMWTTIHTTIYVAIALGVLVIAVLTFHFRKQLLLLLKKLFSCFRKKTHALAVSATDTGELCVATGERHRFIVTTV